MLISFADITHNGEYFYDEEFPFSYESYRRNSRTRVSYLFDPFVRVHSNEPELVTPKEGLAEKIDYCHASDISEERLSAYVDITSFRGGPGMVKAEINFEIPCDEIDLESGSGAKRSEVEFRVLVRDARMDSITFASECITTAAPEIRQRPYADLIQGQVRVTLEPGYYRFGIEVIDRRTGRSSSYRESIRLPVLDGRLAVSDIQFAGRIRETEEYSRFVKGTLEVVPHPTHIYKKPRPVIFYFEMYGLDIDSDGLAFYAVEYTISPLGKRRWGPVLLDVDSGISSAFETSGFGSTQPLRLTIDTAELWEGSYELLVAVKDRRTLETVRQRSTFFILE